MPPSVRINIMKCATISALSEKPSILAISAANTPPQGKSLPKNLKKQVAQIDGFSLFTVGLSDSGEPFVWGSTKDKLLKLDYKKIPAPVREGAAYIAAGKDHILALTKKGELVGWGDNSCGQYGFEPVLNALATPEELREGIPPSEVKQLVCGYQTSALVSVNGRAWLWGNLNVVRNLSQIAALHGVKQIAFTTSTAVALLQNGQISTGGERAFTSAVSLREGVKPSLESFLADKNESLGYKM